MIELIGFTCLTIGVLFDIFGCIGLIRLPDVYNRLQASTKSVTLGTCGILSGVIVLYGATAPGIKAFLAILFIMLTAPTAAHALSRAARLSGIALWEKK